MEANELRIGNYAVYGGSYIRMDVREFTNFVRFPETYSPEVLTEEWLIKFGFTEFGSKDRMVVNNNGRSLAVEFAECRNLWLWQGIELKYVHQLQNLFFALTGEELTYKNN